MIALSNDFVSLFRIKIHRSTKRFMPITRSVASRWIPACSSTSIAGGEVGIVSLLLIHHCMDTIFVVFVRCSAAHKHYKEELLRDLDIDPELANCLAAIRYLPQLAVCTWSKGGQHGYGEVVGRTRLYVGRQVVSIRAGM